VSRSNEITAIFEDLMRVADDLKDGGDEVNAFLVDQVLNRRIDRAFGGSGCSRRGADPAKDQLTSYAASHDS
jgi:hypothetical protein